MKTFNFSKADRVRKRDEFIRVYNSKVFAADKTLVITAVKNDLERTRIGLSISKRVGNAVVRNLWKRRIREAFRQQKSVIPPGIDMVIRPRKGAECNWDNIKTAMVELSKRVAQKALGSN